MAVPEDDEPAVVLLRLGAAELRGMLWIWHKLYTQESIMQALDDVGPKQGVQKYMYLRACSQAGMLTQASMAESLEMSR